MLSRFFIHRPIFATVIALLTMVAGLVALPLLPIEQYPEITPPTVRVSVRYPVPTRSRSPRRSPLPWSRRSTASRG